MHADQMRLRQGLLNLMSNANKFTERGTITIDARHRQENDDDWITLAVTDTPGGRGPGWSARAFVAIILAIVAVALVIWFAFGG
jgi:K+-sensing histidine kinase KdpD